MCGTGASVSDRLMQRQQCLLTIRTITLNAPLVYVHVFVVNIGICSHGTHASETSIEPPLYTIYELEPEQTPD